MDDLYFGKRSLNAAGNLDWGTLLPQILHDLLVRIAHIADIYGELIFASGSAKSIWLVAGHSQYTPRSSLPQTASSRAPSTPRNLSADLSRRDCRVFPFLLLWCQPALTGTTLLFTSATIGYFSGLGFIGAISALSANIAPSEYSPRRLGVIITLVVLATLHCEVGALMVAA